jgi:hypothetical protein
MSRARIAAVLAVALAVAPIAFLALAGDHPAKLEPVQHFGLVGGAAALASLASLLLSLAGARARDGRAILMGTAFSTMTALFAIHALSTPGFFVGKNGMIALAGGLSVPAGVFLLALTALPALRRPVKVRALLMLQLTLFVTIIGYGLFCMVFPQDIPAVPKVGSTPANVLFGIGGTCLIILIVRAVRTFRLTRRAADLTVAVGCTWLGVTLYANLILAEPPYLRLREVSRHWRIYSVVHPKPMVTAVDSGVAVPADAGAASIRWVGRQGFALDVSRPGLFLVRVNFTPYWSISRGSGCLLRAPGGWTLARTSHPGVLRVDADLSAGAAWNAVTGARKTC